VIVSTSFASPSGARQVRRLDVAKTPGLNRTTWNLRGDPPQGEGRGGGRGAGGGGGRGAGAGGSDNPSGEPQPAAQGFGGRGGAPQGALVAAGRYRATLGVLSGDAVKAIGQPQAFQVVALPK